MTKAFNAAQRIPIHHAAITDLGRHARVTLRNRWVDRADRHEAAEREPIVGHRPDRRPEVRIQRPRSCSRQHVCAAARRKPPAYVRQPPRGGDRDTSLRHRDDSSTVPEQNDITLADERRERREHQRGVVVKQHVVFEDNRDGNIALEYRLPNPRMGERTTDLAGKRGTMLSLPELRSVMVGVHRLALDDHPIAELESGPGERRRLAILSRRVLPGMLTTKTGGRRGPWLRKASEAPRPTSPERLCPPAATLTKYREFGSIAKGDRSSCEGRGPDQHGTARRRSAPSPDRSPGRPSRLPQVHRASRPKPRKVRLGALILADRERSVRVRMVRFVPCGSRRRGR